MLVDRQYWRSWHRRFLLPEVREPLFPPEWIDNHRTAQRYHANEDQADESIIVYDKEGRSLHKIDGMRLRSSHPVASPQGMETYLRETFPTAALARLEVDNHEQC